jgi:hypothetical protein
MVLLIPEEKKKAGNKKMTQTQKLEEQTNVEATEEYQVEQLVRTIEDARDALAKVTSNSCQLCGRNTKQVVCGRCLGE